VSATITMGKREIQLVFGQPAPSSAQRLEEQAQAANHFAAIIESSWDQISPETRELLKVFAYAVIEPPQGIRQKLGRFYLAIVLFGLAIKDEIDSFVAYNNAFDRLFSAILNQVEREDEAYQQALSEALSEAFAGWETSKAMTADEACKQVRQISKRALSEL